MFMPNIENKKRKRQKKEIKHDNNMEQLYLDFVITPVTYFKKVIKNLS